MDKINIFNSIQIYNKLIFKIPHARPTTDNTPITITMAPLATNQIDQQRLILPHTAPRPAPTTPVAHSHT